MSWKLWRWREPQRKKTLGTAMRISPRTVLPCCRDAAAQLIGWKKDGLVRARSRVRARALNQGVGSGFYQSAIPLYFLLTVAYIWGVSLDPQCRDTPAASGFHLSWTIRSHSLKDWQELLNQAFIQLVQKKPAVHGPKALL